MYTYTSGIWSSPGDLGSSNTVSASVCVFSWLRITSHSTAQSRLEYLPSTLPFWRGLPLGYVECTPRWYTPEVPEVYEAVRNLRHCGSVGPKGSTNGTIGTGRDADDVPVGGKGSAGGAVGGTRRRCTRREALTGASVSEVEKAAALALGWWSRLERRGAASEGSIFVEIGSLGRSVGKVTLFVLLSRSVQKPKISVRRVCSLG